MKKRKVEYLGAMQGGIYTGFKPKPNYEWKWNKNYLVATKSRMIDLTLTRKDAEYMYLMLSLPTVEKEFTVGKDKKARVRILNKLKRQGIE